LLFWWINCAHKDSYYFKGINTGGLTVNSLQNNIENTTVLPAWGFKVVHAEEAEWRE